MGLAAKIKNLQQLVVIIKKLRLEKKRTVFTNGCFDILHYGHVKYLQRAKALGDVLVVAVNSDSSIRKIKGTGRPLVNEHDRMFTLAALESVDYLVKFSSPTPLALIEKLSPDILVKGGDWKPAKIVGSAFVTSGGGRVVSIPLEKGRSTTALIEKIAKRYRA